MSKLEAHQLQFNQRSFLVNFMGLFVLGETALVIQLWLSKAKLTDDIATLFICMELIVIILLLFTKFLYMAYFRSISISGKRDEFIDFCSSLAAFISIFLHFAATFILLYAVLGCLWPIHMALIAFIGIFIFAGFIECRQWNS